MLSKQEINQIAAAIIEQLKEYNRPELQEDKLLDMNEAAEFLHISKSYLYHIKDEIPQPIRPKGAKILFLLSDLMKYKKMINS